jgi:tyrosyl-tRNA synthetase
LLAKSGEKFGKTAEGAVWLSAERTSPFAFRQFFMDQPDEQLEQLLHRLTLDSAESISELLTEHAKNPGARTGQRRLATAVTTLVHGESEELRARAVAETLFGGPEGRGSDPRALDAAGLAALASEIPTAPLPTGADATLLDLVAAAGFATSKSEARRLVEQGGISVNGEAAGDPAASASSFVRLADGSLLLRKGRRDYRMLRAG